MNTTFFHALILAVCNIVLTLIGFFLGFQTDKMAEGRWFGLLSLAVGIAVTWLGVKAVREESADKSLSFGKGVKTGFLINLYAGGLGSKKWTPIQAALMSFVDRWFSNATGER